MFKCLNKLYSLVVHCRELSHSSNVDLQEQMNGNKVFCESSVLSSTNPC